MRKVKQITKEIVVLWAVLTLITILVWEALDAMSKISCVP